jgi:hypothetical protein
MAVADTHTAPSTTKIVPSSPTGGSGLPWMAADTAALLRIALGLVYVWGFISQAIP